jgi:hypothetical protein
LPNILLSLIIPFIINKIGIKNSLVFLTSMMIIG